MNICRITGCVGTPTGKNHRCSEHAETCLAEGCDTPSPDAVRCSKHAARYIRLGHSALKCKHAGCPEKPFEDRSVCTTHLGGPDELQQSLDDAVELLAKHGTVRFVKIAF